MQAKTDCLFFRRYGFAGFALLCALSGAHAVEPATPGLMDQVYQLRNLAETQREESLKQLNQLKNQLAPGARLDDKRLVLAALISTYLKDDQRELARKLNGELNDLAIQYKDNYSKSLVLNFQANIYTDEARLNEAKKSVDQALVVAKSVNDKKLNQVVNKTASIVYGNLGDYNASLQFQIAAMEAMDGEDRHDDMARIDALNSLGTIYLDLKDPKLALDYFHKGIKLAEELDAQRMLAMLTLNMGNAYTDLERHQEAIKANLETQRIAQLIADRRLETIATNNLSDSYFRLGKFDQCLHFARKTLSLSEKIENEELQSSAIINIGLCRMGLGEVIEGAKDVNGGIERLRKENSRSQIEPVLGQLASAFEKQGMYKEAYKAVADQLALSIELYKSDRDRAVAEMKAKYDASEQEKQIEVLEQRNQIQNVELQNRSLQRIIAILATLIAIAVAISILYLYRKARLANRNLEEANIKLAHQSTRDPLTGLFNRRAFHDAMKFRTQMTDRRVSDNINPPHALVMLDIDHFKRINDTFGHASGDAVLIEISKRLTHVMRDKDMLMRWGGEEFLIFLNHIPTKKLPEVVERILISVGGRPVVFEHHSIPSTISAGYISLPLGVGSEVDLNWEKMLNLADSALYMAKTRGRNQAIGIQINQVNQEELDELLQGNLEHAISLGKVSIEKIAGPVQNEATTEF